MNTQRLIAIGIGIISFLMVLLIGIIGYFSTKALDEIDQLKTHQAQAQENHVVIMERMGVSQTDIKRVEAQIDEIRKEIRRD